MTGMTTRDVLVAARALIADERAWTRKSLARDEGGDPVDATSPRAVCWCVEGALSRTACLTVGVDALWQSDAAYQLYHNALESLRRVAETQEIYVVNDRRGHGFVLGLVARAIAESST